MCEDCRIETESTIKKLMLLSVSFVFVIVTVVAVAVTVWNR
jgi:hypothetical protein